LVAKASGWEKVRDRRVNAAQNVSLLLTWELLPGIRVTYTEEESLESSFVMATSSLDEESLRNPVTLFSVHPEVLSLEDLLSELDSSNSPDRRSVAVTRLGVGAPLKVDDRLFSRIEQCAFSEENIVREGAVWAIIYSEWFAFRETLRSISENDSDQFLRELASGAITALERVSAEDS
jgi:hypothetical protein